MTAELPSTDEAARRDGSPLTEGLGLEPKHDPWAILGRFFKTWVGSALYDGGGAEVDLEEPYEAFRAIHAQQKDALGPNVRGNAG